MHAGPELTYIEEMICVLFLHIDIDSPTWPSLQVLTRREQLGLAAKQKEDKQATGKGGGRGGGRGRGRGRKASNTTKASEPEHVPEPLGANGSEKDCEMETEKEYPSASLKRPAMQTPERRRLFPDDMPPGCSEVSPSKPPGMVASPPIRQDRKKPKRAAKSKAKAKAKSKAALPTEEEPRSGEGKGEEVKEPSGPRQPSNRVTQWAMTKLAEAKQDSPAWHHVCKLFEGTNVPERSCGDKLMYFSFSMYWLTRRVGLLQKQPMGGNKHLLSFGGGHCIHIGIPYVASRLYVGYSVAPMLKLLQHARS